MSNSPSSPSEWTPPESTLEELRDKAIRYLARIDRDRNIQRLIEQGLSEEDIVQRTGQERRFITSVQQCLKEGIEVRPLTPEELGYRRAVGQISTQDMMEQLRSWPYTFGQAKGYDGYQRGSWDEVERLRFHQFISKEEYRELRDIADASSGQDTSSHISNEHRP